MTPQLEFKSKTLNKSNEESSAQTEEFADKEINCTDCGADFIWSAGEQIFFRDKNLTNPPKRCKKCKKAKNERINAVLSAQKAGIKQRVEVAIHCAQCQCYTTVPFYPSQGRPVLCRSCFLEKNPELLNGDSPE